MTIFGPLVMLTMMIVPYWMSSNTDRDVSILINDQSGMLDRIDSKIDYLRFAISNVDETIFKKILIEGTYDAYVSIPKNPYVSQIEVSHNPELKGVELELIKMELNQLLICKSSFTFLVHPLGDEKEKLNTTKMFLSLLASISIYFFIFLYGIQVMKGVIEEKNNRIIEVMISSVKPFQLMIGKILGMSLLALTQFVIWLVVIVGGYTYMFNRFGLENYMKASAIKTVTEAGTMSFDTAVGMHEFVTTMNSINFPVFLAGFLFFFLFGYLIYSALFAIVGAASDVDTETQQFIMPITVPLLSTMVFISQMFVDPHSGVMRFLSFFPLTSPLAMTARLPFGESYPGFYIELVVSMVLAVLGFLGIAFIAARIYRIGILSYGVKVGFKDLAKWFFMKD